MRRTALAAVAAIATGITLSTMTAANAGTAFTPYETDIYGPTAGITLSVANVTASDGQCVDALIQVTTTSEGFYIDHPDGTIDVRDPQNVDEYFDVVDGPESFRVPLCGGQDVWGTYTVTLAKEPGGTWEAESNSLTTTFTFTKPTKSTKTSGPSGPVQNGSVSDGCVSKKEYRKIHRGMKRAKVEKMTDDHVSQKASGGHGRVTRAYLTCDGGHAAMVTYSKKSTKVISKRKVAAN